MSGYAGELKKAYLATGVGSMPHGTARSAVECVFDTFTRHIPFWPQLPKRSFLENMYVQFSGRLPGLKIDEQARRVWLKTDDAAYAEELEECFKRCEAKDEDHFALTRAEAEGLFAMSERLLGTGWQGWVKAQAIGPISLGLSLTDEKNRPILFNAEMSELLPAVLALKAGWVIGRLKLGADTKVIIFIDEPYLVAIGTSGCSLSRETIIGKIDQVVEAIHAKGALAGIHCCGNTDWELVMATKIDILNFDAYGYFDKLTLYEKPLAAFLARGGIFAPGIVPATDEVDDAALGDRLFEILRRRRDCFSNGALVTPSCGLSGLHEDAAVRALRLCAGLAERMSRGF